jgi:hypothetical protein
MCPLVSFHERPDHVIVWARVDWNVQRVTQLKTIQSTRVVHIIASDLSEICRFIGDYRGVGAHLSQFLDGNLIQQFCLMPYRLKVSTPFSSAVRVVR